MKYLDVPKQHRGNNRNRLFHSHYHQNGILHYNNMFQMRFLNKSKGKDRIQEKNVEQSQYKTRRLTRESDHY